MSNSDRIDKENQQFSAFDATGQYVYGSKPLPKGGLALRERFARRGDKNPHRLADGRGRIEGIYAIKILLNQGNHIVGFFAVHPKKYKRLLIQSGIFLLIAGRSRCSCRAFCPLPSKSYQTLTVYSRESPCGN